MSDEKKLVLFHCPQMAGLAQGVRDAIASKGKIELGSVRWGEFSDGWPNNFIEDVSTKVRGRRVAFLASFDTPADVFRQLSVIYGFPRYVADEFTLILPFFPVGTKDRVEKKGDIVTSKTLGRMLDAIPRPRRGTSVVRIYDIHAMQEQLYFSDNILIDLETTMRLLRQRLTQLRSQYPVKIVFPDEGARKRFGTEFDDFPQVICEKHKVGNERHITIKEGDPSGAYCVTVDDLILSGATIIECAEVLAAAGAAGQSVFVPHAVCPKDSWKRFAGEELFEHVWVTDSCPMTIEKLPIHSRFEVLSLASLIAEDLLK